MQKVSKPLSKKHSSLLATDERIAKSLDTGLKVLHTIGERIFGPLWRTLFESVQDAITLGLLVQIPSLLSKFILGQEFSGMDICWDSHNVYAVARYACFAVVLSDYTLWAVLIPRTLFRFVRDFRTLIKELLKS